MLGVNQMEAPAGGGGRLRLVDGNWNHHSFNDDDYDSTIVVQLFKFHQKQDAVAVPVVSITRYTNNGTGGSETYLFYPPADILVQLDRFDWTSGTHL